MLCQHVPPRVGFSKSERGNSMSNSQEERKTGKELGNLDLNAILGKHEALWFRSFDDRTAAPNHASCSATSATSEIFPVVTTCKESPVQRVVVDALLPETDKTVLLKQGLVSK
jgi:hypothetical protein